MKGKRHTTEQKIRILRAADGGKSIVHQPKPKTNTPPGSAFGGHLRLGFCSRILRGPS